MEKIKKITLLLILGVIFASCEKSSPLDDYTEVYGEALTDTTTNNSTNIAYNFDMAGRCYQDPNGYYHLGLIEGENQTLHRFGAYVTNIDKWNLPTQVIWSCEAYWEFNGNTVPIVNGTSYADPNVDSVFCMMAPIFEMQGDTVLIQGQAWFEEGDIIKYDSFNIIFE